MAGQLREVVAELACQVRREPGCLTFTAYLARDTRGRFCLYVVYASAAAFEEHLQAQYLHDFIAAVPAPGIAEPGSLVQLDEIAFDWRRLSAGGAMYARPGDRRDSCRARR